MLSHLRNAVIALFSLTVLAGVVYPILVTAVAQIVFPRQANGSLVLSGGRAVGSELIGQPFDDPAYFWPRPSATTPPFNGASSSGSNQGPTNPALLDAVRARIAALRSKDPNNPRPVPIDLVTASASGLDPHISPEAAIYQVTRVARTRGIAPELVAAVLERHVEPRQLGVLGEPRVNVLLLNLDLDAATRR